MNGSDLSMNTVHDPNSLRWWIFQGNPKYYNVIGAVADLNTLTWAVNQYGKQIKKGDKAYIWVSGPKGGIIASGTILCDPEMKEPVKDDPYNLERDHATPFRAVDIQLERRFVITRTSLLADERTKSLQILVQPNATNFPVTQDQASAIENILVGGTEPEGSTGQTVVSSVSNRKYWMYAPGEGARLWDEFFSEGIMGLGWDELGDLRQYSTKEAMKKKMKAIYGEEYSYKNAAHATWQFANDIRPGDIVFAKRGVSKILGRGIVTSTYMFDETRDEYNHTHRINWTHRGEWKVDERIIMKTLTDITPYTDYHKRLESMFAETEDSDLDQVEESAIYETYTKEDFLSEVFTSEKDYIALKGLLLKKKNLILQGPPGVGKTYAAERLAYSIMGQKDTSRVRVVQFHQSYSYEDFVMGFRPDGQGFSLKHGPFYDFCKEAEPDDREYFFIIDEINRGNLSKIFGELLMLIENDKRGEKHAIRLLYSDEQFHVPDNVHIIGMMNTADRSLALIDYALRRRFAFFEFQPGFQTEGFKKHQASVDNKKFDALVEVVNAMNRAISDDNSLGEGFQIGHSYFTESAVDDEWLSGLVEFELIPLIKEYWFDEPPKVQQWEQKLRGAINGA